MLNHVCDCQGSISDTGQMLGTIGANWIECLHVISVHSSWKNACCPEAESFKQAWTHRELL